MTADVHFPVRGAECPPAFELERFSVGDAVEFEAHVASCDACTRYVAGLRGYADAFTKARPTDLFLRQVERRTPPPSRWRWSFIALPAALAAMVTVVVATRSEVPDVRFKGEPLHVYVKRGALGPVVAGSETRLHPGDVVRFSYRAPAPGFVALFQLDGTENVEVALPTTLAVPVLEGEQLLPGARVLDASPGPESFVGVYAPKSLDVQALAAQLKGQARNATIEVTCEGCQVHVVRLEKVAP